MTDSSHESVERIPIQPPDIDRLDSKDFTLSYDEHADTMFIYFVSGDIQPISVLVDPDNDIYALVDAASRDVVGVQLEAYLARIVHEWPEFLPLAIWAGISPDQLEPAIRKIGDQKTRHEGYGEVQRRLFDLSVKEQIERFFHVPGDREIVATA